MGAESENPSIYKYNGDSSETSLFSVSSFITSLQSENRPPNNIQNLRSTSSVILQTTTFEISRILVVDLRVVL